MNAVRVRGGVGVMKFPVSGRSRDRLVLLAALWLGVSAISLDAALAQPAAPVTSQQSFSIPAGSLASALVMFGQQAGLQISYAPNVAAGKRTDGVSGTMAPQNALARLLAGTNLSWRFSGGSTVTVFDPSAANETVNVGDDATVLDVIDVLAQRNPSSGSGYQGTPDWVYQTPAAVSVISRDAIVNAPTRNARDLFDNVAGVYANRAEAQNPGIAVNVRGLQDQDRVVMMIDGARQSFQRGGHGVTQRTYVDTSFVREVDIEKSTTSGVGSLGSLGGSVNFRTLLAEDLIEPGRQWGGELNATTGTNGFRFDGSVVGAVHLSDSLSVLAGVSRKKIGSYEVGKNGTLRNQNTTTTGDVMLFSGQEVFSTILKAEAKFNDDMKLTLGWVRNDSRFSTGNYASFLGGMLVEAEQSVINNTLTAAFDWKTPNELIDLKARLYFNHIDNEDWGVSIGGKPRYFTMATLGASIENTSRFDTPLGLLSFHYGAEAFRDDGKSTVPSFILDGVDMAERYNGGTPSGRRDVAGGFINTRLEHGDWLTVEGGARYDWYHIAGTTTIYDEKKQDVIGTIVHPGTPPMCLPPPLAHLCVPGSPSWTEDVLGPEYYPPREIRIDRSEGALLPTFTVAVKPFDWLQPFIKYSKSLRPPTAMEAFLASGHTNDGIDMWAPNPSLRPERGETWEFGVNISKNGLLASDDTLRLKVVRFYRDVKDYIALGRGYIEETDKKVYASPVNLAGTTRMQGVEVEANYDARAWYLGGAFTLNKTDWSDTYSLNGVTEKLGPNTAVIFVQPEKRLTIDGGVRLFNEKLTIGGRMIRVGKTEPTIGTLENNYKLPAYTIYDLYGSFAFTENIKLRFNVSNLTDVAYVSALGADYYAMPGRTYTAALNFKF